MGKRQFTAEYKAKLILEVLAEESHISEIASREKLSRSKGHSAIEKAAFLSGEKLASDYNGRAYDYKRKGGVAHTEIFLPDHAPREYTDRSVLWNAVERIEKNDSAQLAHEFAKRIFVSAGMCADVCVHDKGDGNPHAYIMLTLRPIEANGRWGAKSKKEYVLDEKGERIRLPSGEYKSRKVNAVDWNEQSKAEDWRAAWADTANEFLAKHGIADRIDHRSYERQGKEKVATIHLGPTASQMERKGIKTERGEQNRKERLAVFTSSDQRPVAC